MDTANARRLPEKGAVKVVEMGGRNASRRATATATATACIKGTGRRIDAEDHCCLAQPMGSGGDPVVRPCPSEMQELADYCARKGQIDRKCINIGRCM